MTPSFSVRVGLAVASVIISLSIIAALQEAFAEDIPTISINDIATTEGNSGSTNFVYTIARSGNTTGISSIQVATSDGSATIANSDYNAITTTTLDFAANEISKTITVVVNGDITLEGDETFFVNLSNCIGCTVSDGQGVGTIINDDIAPPTISVNDVSDSEGNSGTKNFVFTLSRSGNTAGTSSIQYATADNTATVANSDYATVALSTVVFSAGEATKTITVSVIGDANSEPNETFFVNLSNCIDCTVSDGQGVGTIQNDDTAAPTITINDVTMPEGASGTKNFVFTITRTGATAGTSTVSYATADGTASSPGDFASIPATSLTFAAGETTKTVIVVASGDTTVEPNETFFVNLSNCVGCTISDNQGVGTIQNDDTAAATISITNVSNEEGNSGTRNFVFTVSRSGSTIGTSTVSYSTSSGSASAPGDFTAKSGTVSFSANEVQKTVSITVKGDTTVESDETFSVNLSNCVSCTISDNQGTGTIENDDSAPSTVSIVDVSQSEGSSGTKNFIFKVKRAGSMTERATVNFATSAGTASSPGDFTAKSGTLSFSADELEEEITIAVTGDSTFEPNETFIVTLSSCSGCTISDSQATGTIQNDDSAPPPTISINDASLVEGNSGNKNIVFTVTRSGSTTAESSVNYATANNAALTSEDYGPVPLSTLTFSIGEKTKTITVAVHGDTTVEPNETFSVNLSTCENCTITDAQGIGTIQNDDTAPSLPSVAISDLSLAEGNSGTQNFIFTVTRSGNTAGQSSINYDTSAGTATSPADFASTSGTLSFAAGEKVKTITVPVTGDSLFEPAEAFTVTISQCVNCTITDAQGTGQIVNDDAKVVTPGITINDVAFHEGSSGTSSFVFTITRDGDLRQPSSLNYSISAGTASASADFTVQSSKVQFVASESKKTIMIAVRGDTTVEPDETFFVNLSDCTGCTIVDNQGLGTIQNDDTVTLDTDGDGVPNNVDRCATQPGSKENNGCPSSSPPPIIGGGSGSDVPSFLGYNGPTWVLPAVLAGAAVAVLIYLRGRVGIKFTKT